MKEGWERKKIKEVADVVGGSTPKTNVEEYWGGDNYWVTPAELDGSKYINKTVRCITSKAVDKTNLTLMPSGTVLLSSRAPIGKVCITKAPMYCNQGFKNIVCKELLYNEFAYYFLKHNVDYLQSLGTGATFKEISKKVVENVTIPVPPLSEQQHIVEELDLLSSIIEKKKAQLNELDNLAQSLFYEMFGDSIDNTKGWDVRKLEDLLKIPSRNGLSKPTAIRGEGVPMISMGEMFANSIITDKVKASLVPVTERELDTSQIVSGDLLFARQSLSLEGAGKCSFVKSCIHPTVFESHLIRIRVDSIVVLPQFVFCYFQTPCGIAEVRKRVYQVAAAGIKGSELVKIPIPVPPIDLQKEFASKIEAIDHQKELFKQSIREVETLFNSRMDYYFN